MAEATTPLAVTYEEFDRARGDDADGAWAFSVSWSLMTQDVDPAQVREGLEEALEVVRETRESPRDLFGEPRAHAEALYEQWSSEGRLHLQETTPTRRDVVSVGLVLAAVVAVGLLLALRDRDATPRGILTLLLISLAVGTGSSLLHAGWTRRHRWHRHRLESTETPTDVRWSLTLTEILRTRYAMSGARVRDIVAEAHAHAAESGSSVPEEFGTPEDYAARFAPDRARRARLTATLLAVLALLAALPLLDGFDWTSAILCALLLAASLVEVRRTRS